MWFGLPAEIAVRCGHCGETDWRTPVELKSGRLACFMCARISDLSAGSAAPAPIPAAWPLSDIARRLATLQPWPAATEAAGIVVPFRDRGPGDVPVRDLPAPEPSAG